MKKTTFLLLIFLSIYTNAQIKKEVINEKELSLSKQFDILYKKSGSYQEYKVVKIVKYNRLKQNVVDSLNTLKKTINKKESVIQNNYKEIKEYKKQLVGVHQNLDESILEKDRRSILGIDVEKKIFSTIIVTSYLLLVVLLAFFAFKYKQNLGTTKKAVSDLKSLENEFEDHKRTSLKRIQETNRKLQDELNKNWKKEK